MNGPERARERASIILRVRAGEISATEGARLLGVSRKTYYEWEQKGLSGMVESLEDQEAGRPAMRVDPEKEMMRQRIQELEKEVDIAKQSESVRRILQVMEEKQNKKKGKLY